MASISGTTSETVRIIIVDESDWSVENNTVVSGTNYEINVADTNDRIVIGRTNSGEVISYSGVNGI